MISIGSATRDYINLIRIHIFVRDHIYLVCRPFGCPYRTKKHAPFQVCENLGQRVDQSAQLNPRNDPRLEYSVHTLTLLIPKEKKRKLPCVNVEIT